MFTRARLALSRATQDLEKAPEYEFTKLQLCALWEMFGSDLTSSDNLNLPEIQFTEKCCDTFDFKKVDLPGKLVSSRNRIIDRVSQLYVDQCQLGGKRDREDRPAPSDRNAPKRVNPGKQGKQIKGFCYFYYAYLAEVIYLKTNKKYHDCRGAVGCKRFGHVSVTSTNKEEIKNVVLKRYEYTSVKVAVEAYLNKFKKINIEYDFLINFTVTDSLINL